MGQILGMVTAAAQLGLESIAVTPSRYLGPFVAQVTVEEQHVDELEITEHPVETGARITDHAYMRPAELTVRACWSNSPGGAGTGGLEGLLSGVIGPARSAISGLGSIGNLAGAVGGGIGNALGGAASALSGSIGGALGNVPGLSSLLSGSGTTQVRQIYESLILLQRERIPVEVATGKRVYENMLVKSIRTTTSKETENALDVVIIFRQVMIVQTQVVTVAAPAAAQAAPEATAPVEDKGEKAPDDSWATADATELQASVNPTPPLAPDNKPALPEGYRLDPKTGNVYNRQGIVDTSATIRYDNNQPITPPPS